MPDVRATSKEAFVGEVSSGAMETQLMQVLEALRKGPGTAQEIGVSTELGAHIVSRRRGDLLRRGLIMELPPIACPVTGRQARPVMLTDAGFDVLDGLMAMPEPGPSRAERRAREMARLRGLMAEVQEIIEGLEQDS